MNVADNADLDPLPTRWGYAVFGKVIEGIEIVDRISVSPTGSMGPFKQDAPLQPVIIQKVELLTDGNATPSATAPAATPSSPAAPSEAPPSANPAATANPSTTTPALPAEPPSGAPPPK